MSNIMFKFFDLVDFTSFIKDYNSKLYAHKIISDNIFYNDERIMNDVHKLELEYIKDNEDINIIVHGY